MALDRAKTMQQAEKYVKSGKMTEAINAYKKLVEDNPRDLNIFNKLGDLYVRAKKTPDAIRFFLRIAELYSKDGFLLKAIAMYKKICKLDPSNMDCVLKLAEQYQQQGLTIEAKVQYLQVVDHLVKTSQFKKAVEIFPKILEIDPANIKVRLTYADILTRTSRKDDAVREFVQVATDLIGEGMRDEAAQVVRKGLEVAPGNADLTSLMLATGKEGKKDPAELLSSVEAMAKENGDNPRSQAMLVEAYLSAGKKAQAEPVVAKLQELGDGAPPETMLAVGRFRLAEEDADGAREWLGRAADQFMDGSRPADAAAAMEEFLGRFPDDREGLAKRADIAERSNDAKGQTMALQKLAQLLIRMSEIATATEVTRRLTILDPDNERFAELLTSLEARTSGDASVAPPQDSLESLQLEEAPAGVDLSSDDEVNEEEVDEEEVDEEEVDDEFISDHFTEAEVFIKYGLLEKAKQQLLTILAKHPRHVMSHVKLKEIYYEEGNKDKAVEECLTLTEMMRAKGRDDDALELMNEAIRIDPNNPRVKELSAEATPEAVAPAAAPADPEVGTEPPAPEPEAGTEPPAPEPIAAPSTPPAQATPVAEAPPELAIEDNSGATITLQSADISTAAGVDEMEIQIDMGDESAVPPTAPTAAEPSVAAKPETIEEETPDDLASFSLSEGDDSFSIEIDGDASPDAPGSAAAAEGATDPDPEKLGEVDFYIDQGLLEEAREVLFQLHKKFPDSKEVADRFARANRPVAETPEPPKKGPAPSSDIDLDVERAFGAQSLGGGPPAEAPVPKGTKATPVFRVEETSGEEQEGDFFDLASELDKSLSEAQVAVEGPQESLDGPGVSLDEIFKAFKKGVEQQVDAEDYETHYNLGIAYREMGLVDEAIGEFQFAAKDAGRIVECCGILGLCFRDKGMPDLALKWYRKGLDSPDVGEHEVVGLRYDIGEVYREQGEYQKALQSFTEVYGIDSNYREVVSKLEEVRKLLG